MAIDGLRRDIADLSDRLDRARTSAREILAQPIEVEAQPVVVDLAWLDACPPGERREFRYRVGAVEEVHAVDRRTVDARTLAEHVVHMSPKAREHLAVLLDLLASEGVGGEAEVREAGECLTRSTP